MTARRSHADGRPGAAATASSAPKVVGRMTVWLLDLPDGSDTLRATSNDNDMVTMSRGHIWRWALPLAVLLLMFCLSAAPPAVAEEPACGGPNSSERVCAQSGTGEPIPALAPQLVATHTVALPTSPLPRDEASPEPLQHHADLATPRAPPSLT